MNDLIEEITSTFKAKNVSGEDVIDINEIAILRNITSFDSTGYRRVNTRFETTDKKVVNSNGEDFTVVSTGKVYKKLT